MRGLEGREMGRPVLPLRVCLQAMGEAYSRRGGRTRIHSDSVPWT